MNLEHFLDLFFRSNIILVEVLFGLVLAGIIFLTIRTFTRPETETSGSNLKGLEDGIKKILDNYSVGKPMVATSAREGDAGSPIELEEMSTQIERLKIQLIQKSEEVEQLKAQVSAVGANSGASAGSLAAVVSVAPATASPVTASSGDTSVLEEKIKDLEARLSEYSIIEDDIADLSFYKEETLRLQDEVKTLKEKLLKYESGATEESHSLSSDEKSKFSEAGSNSKIEESSAQLGESNLNDQKTSESVPMAEVTESKTENVNDAVDDDIMAEFERAVAEQKAVSSSEKMATSLPPPEAPNKEVNKGEDSEKVAENSETSSTDDATAGGINLDKMLSEVGSLSEQESTEVTNVLEQALDTDKLLEEATGMDKIDTNALDEFDQFLKKESA